MTIISRKKINTFSLARSKVGYYVFSQRQLLLLLRRKKCWGGSDGLEEEGVGEVKWGDKWELTRKVKNMKKKRTKRKECVLVAVKKGKVNWEMEEKLCRQAFWALRLMLVEGGGAEVE